MAIRYLGLFIALTLHSTAFSQNINTFKLDSFFNALETNNKIMGSFAIAKNGSVVYKRSIGYSSIPAPASENTLYHIGSVTKMFTAVMAFQLVEEGKLSLNTTLDTWFPAIPNSRLITIETLLEHRSGLFDFLNDQPDRMWLKVPRSKEEILSVIIKGKVHFLPNSKFSYCNSGYFLLAYIIEKITGLPYEDNLQKRICNKIGLKNTYSSISGKPKSNEAASYIFINKWEEVNEVYVPNTTGAGDMLSTPMDLISFNKALFNGKLISKSSLDLMKTIKGNGFGMGMQRIPFYSHKGYGHGGHIEGMYAMTANFIDDSLIIAYCINGQIFPQNDIAIAMLSIGYGLDYKMPTFNNTKVTDQILNKYIGIYSSNQTPIKIKVINAQGTLMAKVIGQSFFTLEAVKDNLFKQDAINVIMDFDSAKSEMTFIQDGKIVLFKKE